MGRTDTITERLQNLVSGASDWGAARDCGLIVEQFVQRSKSMRRRAAMPLIAATLGGTGTGKSALINALLGAEVVESGKSRPTTDTPIFICHQNHDPNQWGIDTTGMIVKKFNIPDLESLALIDCPDPDTTENTQLNETNLSRLRAALPHCDVILIVGTQQKYRSRRVTDELTDAAPGARLVFVQTHAERDVDIRDDWKTVLSEHYKSGRIYFVDSVVALNARVAGTPFSQDFTDLHNLLTRDLNEESAMRIRDSNFADLAEEAVCNCRVEVEKNWHQVELLRDKILEERRHLGQSLAERVSDDMMNNRRLWESRLLERVTSLWGYSPFSVVLRIYQGMGTIVSTALLSRVRSLPQLAAWGLWEGTKKVKSMSKKKRPTPVIQTFWEEGQLREAATILSGFAIDAKLPSDFCTSQQTFRESVVAGNSFMENVTFEMERICERIVKRRNNWRTRVFYETLLSLLLLFLLYRPAKNFFWDTFFDPKIPILGFDYYLISLFWLVICSSLLLGVFSYSLRRGLAHDIGESSCEW
ncbi:MAG: 50S ribosome-binding GTPase, partial [Planctomycetaceae bacterium]|nr:50S ribosome-binding GTPase [Planctomycetaceae bacterium]